MAQRAAQSPAGRVTEVFRAAAERQAAYDFLEHDHVSVEETMNAAFRATASQSSYNHCVRIVIDGSSLSLPDRAGPDGGKDFGKVGTWGQRGRGLKVISALALDTGGTPLGLAGQVWWTRQERAPGRGDYQYRRVKERESYHWRTCVDQVGADFAALAPKTALHFIADREADASLFILHLLRRGHEFTIRSNATRKVMIAGQRRNLRNLLHRAPVRARMSVNVRETARRAARVANLEVRAARVPLILRDRYVHNRSVVQLNVVWARERGRAPVGGRLDWVLITNTNVKTATDACDVVHRYTHRWRIEDFHKTWKSGACRVEETQLRSKDAVIKWATILAAVAARTERLRQRARVEPDVAATTELSRDEIEALVLLKIDSGASPTATTAHALDLATAVRWLADLGGYVGNRSSGPPGATTIARGLEQVQLVARVLATAQKLKR